MRDFNYMHDIYILSEIKRYSTVYTLRSESVAEHGFYVAAIVMDLSSKYRFNLGKALAMAISHDMPEIELNDAPHVIKQKYPEIKEAFDICELKVAKLMPKAVQEGIMEYLGKETVASLVVHLADAIQCAQYAQVEVRMGNLGYMKEVLDTSRRRVTILEEGLEKYER